MGKHLCPYQCHSVLKNPGTTALENIVCFLNNGENTATTRHLWLNSQTKLITLCLSVECRQRDYLKISWLTLKPDQKFYSGLWKEWEYVGLGGRATDRWTEEGVRQRGDLVILWGILGRKTALLLYLRMKEQRRKWWVFRATCFSWQFPVTWCYLSPWRLCDL